MDAAPTLELTTTTAMPAPEPDPGPTPEQVAVYVAALQQAEAWAFVDAWWRADLATYVEALRAAQAAATPRLAPSPALRPAVQPAPAWAGSGAPGGFLACVRQRESGGNYRAVNPSSGAGGAYQFLPETWRAMGGQGLPQNASPAEQDRIAQLTLARVGRSPWASSERPC